MEHGQHDRRVRELKLEITNLKRQIEGLPPLPPPKEVTLSPESGDLKQNLARISLSLKKHFGDL